jgi:DNA-binding protein H-NS
VAIDLNSMTLKELKELHNQTGKAIANFEDRKKKEALADLEDRAKAMGFTLAELTGSTPTRKRAPVAPKYANPANKSETWSGRGRKPRWFEAALKAGKSTKDLSI